MLVCGLGSLGQACLRRLIPFQVPLRCLDRQCPDWRDPVLQSRFESQLTMGDMRRPHVLLLAGVAEARAVLLLSSDSTVNFEAALQVRLLNPRAEIVVRSSSQQASLGALLEQQLPGVAVVDPLLLTAGAVAEALRPGNQRASFQVEGQLFLIVAGSGEDHRWQRPLRRGGGGEREPLIVSPMVSRSRALSPRSSPRFGWRWAGTAFLGIRTLPAWIRARPRRQLLLSAVLAALLAVGIPLFSAAGGWHQGAFVTLSLLKGEYVDPVAILLDSLGGLDRLDVWIVLGSFVYALIGTLLTSALVAVILERLLSERLGPPRPRRLGQGSSQILLIQGGDLAVQAARSFARERRGVVRVDDRPPPTGPAVGEATVFRDLASALVALRPCRVEAIGLLSGDLLANLHDALALQRRWPTARLAILAYGIDGAEALGSLLGGVTVIAAEELVADALVATAFGERVEEVCRIEGANLLVVRYRIVPGDTLCGRSIARIENGYGVTAVLLRRRTGREGRVLPSGDSVLAEADELVVLATLIDVRRIELGEMDPPAWCLRLRGAPTGDSRFEALQCLARHLGQAPGAMGYLLDGQERLSPPIDRDIAEPLVEELRRLGVDCALKPISAEEPIAPVP